jgi:preprotein translocase subunit YajC
VKLSIKSVVIVVMVLAVLGSAAVVLAQGNVSEQSRRVNIKGKVTAVGDNRLTLSTAKGKSVTVNVSDETKIRLGKRQGEGSLDDIQVGHLVKVRGRDHKDDAIEARLISVLAGNFVRVRGKVTSISDNTFTLHAKRGDFTILTDDSSRYRTRDNQELSIDNLEVGKQVMVTGTLVEGQEDTILARVINFRRRLAHK